MLKVATILQIYYLCFSYEFKIELGWFRDRYFYCMRYTLCHSAFDTFLSSPVRYKYHSQCFF